MRRITLFIVILRHVVIGLLTAIAIASQAGASVQIDGTGIINGSWSLMTIDKSTGAPTQVGSLGSTGVTVEGLAISPDVNVIPEPTTFVVWSLLGLSAIGIRRRRIGK